MSQNKDFLDDSGLSTLITQMQARFAMLRKGLPGGVAELNSSGKIPIAQESADATLSTSSTNPVQNGVVTTEINNVKQALSNEVVTRSTLGAHNLLQSKAVSTTINSCQVIVNSDKSITISTTPTANGVFNINTSFELPAGTYVLSGCIGGSSTTYYIQMFGDIDYTSGQGVFAPNGDVTFTLTAKNTLSLKLYVRTGFSGTATTIYPMIRLATDSNGEYSPYVPTNSQLLSYKDNGVLGAKNLVDISKTTAVLASTTVTLATKGFSMAVVNGNYGCSKTPLDSLIVGQTYKLTFKVTAVSGLATTEGRASVRVGTGIIEQVMCTTIGSYELIFTHQTDMYLSFFATYSTGNGSMTVDDVMIRLDTDTDPTYQPYAMTNKELTDVAVQEIGNYALKIRRNSLNVTADGTKDYQTLLNELKLAFDSYLTSNSDVYTQPVGVKVDTARYTVDELCSTDGEYHDTTSSAISAFICGMTSTHLSFIKLRIHTTKTNCYMYKYVDGVYSNDSSTVPTSGMKIYLYFDEYIKIS